MGGVLSVACQGFLVREACVGVLVGGAGFLLSKILFYIHIFFALLLLHSRAQQVKTVGKIPRGQKQVGILNCCHSVVLYLQK